MSTTAYAPDCCWRALSRAHVEGQQRLRAKTTDNPGNQGDSQEKKGLLVKRSKKKRKPALAAHT